jgi:hypothetical protein
LKFFLATKTPRRGEELTTDYPDLPGFLDADCTDYTENFAVEKGAVWDRIISQFRRKKEDGKS